MEYRTLGNTDIKVSAICLGTMTFGEQNTEAEGHAQLDYALANEVNFIDTAEMYPVPPTPKTYGDTERIIGTWLASRNCRDKVILASKVAGPIQRAPHIRNGSARLDRENIETAINDSLKRLQTDYLDLYQLHWPHRHSNFFGRLGYVPQADEDFISPQETLEVLADIQKSGKVRVFGLSNESPWGVMKFLHYSQTNSLPRMATVQNPYNLLNRTYEIGLAEISHREQVGLLAYSPLAFGVLSGKYLHDAWPSHARLSLFKHMKRYLSEEARAATAAYVDIAKRHGLDSSQMALAFVTSRPFVDANIIGATTLEQLKTNIDSAQVTLTEEVLQEIEAVHKKYNNPAP